VFGKDVSVRLLYLERKLVKGRGLVHESWSEGRYKARPWRALKIDNTLTSKQKSLNGAIIEQNFRPFVTCVLRFDLRQV
jgi:hypothetical protein